MRSSFAEATQAAQSVKGLAAKLAFLGLLCVLPACAPRYSGIEVNDMLSKGSVEVAAATNRNSVHVSTKGEAVGTSVMANGQAGLAGVLVGAIIVAATAEDDIPNVDNITQPIADLLAKKFPKPDAATENFYKILIAGGPRLIPAADDRYQLAYEVTMQISNIKTQAILLTEPCRETETSLLPLPQWRASEPIIKAFRSKMIPTCADRFAKAIYR